MLGALLLLAGAAGESAPTLTLHGEPGYAGRVTVIAGDFPDLTAIGFDNRAEALRLTPGSVWEVCTEINYRGDCRDLRRDVSDLAVIGLRKRISSVRLVERKAAAARTPPDR